MRFLFAIFFATSLLGAQSELYRSGGELFFEKGCNGCHGTKAEGMHTYPRLAKRDKGYLVNKLRRYRAKEAPTQMSQMMIPFAETLSDEEIDAISTFLSNYRDEQTERYEPAYESWGDGGS